MKNRYYIASCVFTSHFPALSRRIQRYAQERFDLSVVRCCVKKYKVKDFEGRMPEGLERTAWSQLPDSGDFAAGDAVYSLCHNCNNIIEEMHPGVEIASLWELIDQDETFPFPDYSGLQATIQDCWRAKERRAEQDAVRSLLRKMNIEVVETSENFSDTEFCGASLYRPQPARNPKLAPKHYVEGATGKFLPHTPEEQTRLMEEYCRRYTTGTVVCYCHYCLEGLNMGKVNGVHIAHLLFPNP